MRTVTLRLDHLSPTTIKALIEDLREYSDSSMTAETAIWQLAEQLAALVGEDEAKEMLAEQLPR